VRRARSNSRMRFMLGIQIPNFVSPMTEGPVRTRRQGMSAPVPTAPAPSAATATPAPAGPVVGAGAGAGTGAGAAPTHGSASGGPAVWYRDAGPIELKDLNGKEHWLPIEVPESGRILLEFDALAKSGQSVGAPPPFSVPARG
jgi:hypothetical protein